MSKNNFFLGPRCDTDIGHDTNLTEETSSMTNLKTNGLSHSSSTSSLISQQSADLNSQYQGVPRLIVEAGFALFLMTFLVERRHWLWLAASFVIFRFFYSELGRRCIKTFPRDILYVY